ncbi:MAG TPA: SRPBCC family protein [Acidimicrobiales bacterium]
MASIIRETTIDTSPDEAWDALADFGRVHERLAAGFVTGCVPEGPDVRTVTFVGGTTARERLVGVDATARRLAYTVVDGPLGATHHNASAQVVDDGGRVRFVWVTDVLPDELAGTVGDLMDQGLAAIAATLSHPRPPAVPS